MLPAVVGVFELAGEVTQRGAHPFRQHRVISWQRENVEQGRIQLAGSGKAYRLVPATPETWAEKADRCHNLTGSEFLH